MLPIVFLLMFIVIFTVIFNWATYFDDGETAFFRHRKIIVVICVIIQFICFFAGKWIYSNYYTESIEVNRFELLLLNDTSEMSVDYISRGLRGPYYIHIDNNDMYSYYYKTDDCGIKKGKCLSDIATIYEVENSKPAIVKYSIIHKNKLMNDGLANFLVWPSFFKYYNKWETERYEIYVTEGSILKTYNLDAQ